MAELVAEGLTNQAIARRLSIAPRTVETHVENIRRKLQVRSRAQIAAWVTEHRLRPRSASVVRPTPEPRTGHPAGDSGGIARSSPDGRPRSSAPSVKACHT